MSEGERASRVFGVFVGLLDVSKRHGFCGGCGRIVRCALARSRVSLESETRTISARSGKRSGFAIERSVCSCALCLAMRGTCAPFLMPSSRLERGCRSQLEPFWRVRVFFPHSARPGVWWPNARSSGFARLAFFFSFFFSRSFRSLSWVLPSWRKAAKRLLFSAASW